MAVTSNIIPNWVSMKEDHEPSSEAVPAPKLYQTLNQTSCMKYDLLELEPYKRGLYSYSDCRKSIGIDTYELESLINERTRSTNFPNRSIGIDTSDLEAHYEYYKRECVKHTKTVSTDTKDLDYLKKIISTSTVSVDTNDLQTYVDTYLINGFCKVEPYVDIDEGPGIRSNHNLLNSIHNPAKSNNGHCSQKENKIKAKEVNSNVEIKSNQDIEEDSSDDNKFEGDLYIRDNFDSSDNEGNCDESTKKIASQIKSEEVNVPTKRKVGRPKGSTKHDRKSNDYSGRRFECEVCKATFTRKHSLVVHLCIHSGLRPFPCSGCDKAFSTSSQAQRHARMHQQTSSEENVKDEPGSDTGAAQSDSKVQDEDHDATSNELPGDGNYDCAICDTRFDSKQVLIQHKRAVHGLTSRPRECLTCGKAFTCASALKCHETVHTGVRDFACVTCGKAFPTKTCLKAHEATHTGLKKFVCQICGKAFAKKDSLKVHNRKHTNERPFSCDTCGRSFDRAFTLKNHRLTHTGEKTHMCAICGKAFSTRGALSTHERIRHNTDPDKPKVYKRRPRDFEPSVCDQCGKVYSNRGNLRIHKASAHSTEKPFLCTACGRSFAKKYTLQCHARKHSNERPFPCDQCNQSFYRKSTLKTHKLRHTGARPYVCPLNCGKAFTQSSSLSYHVRHHDRPPRATSGKKRRRRKPKSAVEPPLVAPVPLVCLLTQSQEGLPPPPPLTFGTTTYQPNGAPPCSTTQTLAQL